ncbi:hypothetical protein TH9_12200 [Thalassospira xiamenensis]|uniref:hypothetical protein n=1 Tax=Thalassospira xiamenensis TaxID=220697 RepID=UPI000DEDF3B4|nr:hypothetical protein [Thalassospira xiamenensis]RCK32489.1 hypothetical protein TH9_12200 [Thalassospira xiamenensis]
MPIRLSQPKEPREFKLPLDVAVKTRPCTTPVIEMAMSRSGRVIGDIEQGMTDLSLVGHDVDSLRDLIRNPDYRAGIAQFAYACALGEALIMEWSGSGVQDEDGNVGPITPDNIRDVMLHPSIARTFVAEVTKIPVALASEGNG